MELLTGMKNIAIFVSHWSEEQAKYFLEGAKRRTLEGGIKVSMFSSYGEFEGDKPVNFGEYNIFYLPDLSLFDGAIIVANSIYDKSVLEKLVNHINAYNVPLMLADYDLGDDRAYFLGVDNYDGICQIVEHLISKHKCKKIHYISGPDADRENMERQKAFLDTTAKHNIPKENISIISGRYQFADGLSVGARYVTGQLPLPDAIVCANDFMAAGVCDVLTDNGIGVPNDVIVTGFDNYEFSQHYKIKFTTFDRPKEELGYICLDTMFKIANGEKINHKNPIRGRLVLAESCGCNEEQYESNLDYIKRVYINNVTSNNTYSVTKELTDTLLSAKDFETMLASLNKFSTTFFSNSPLLVIDDGFYKSMFRSSDDKRLIRGYSDKSHLFYFNDGSDKLIEIPFPTRELVPEEMTKLRNNTFNFFMPLHFQGRNMGYIVTDAYSMQLATSLRINLLSSLGNAFENMHQRTILNRYSKKFQTLALIDSFTGLYNRLGFKEYGEKLYEECIKRGDDFFVIFIDIDGLKWINDHLGHEFGDIAIKKIAQAITSSCPDKALPIRFGGDEFIVLGPGGSDVASSLADEISGRLTAINENEELGFTLSVSFGFRTCSQNESTPLSDLISEADREMYVAKQRKKADRQS